jgi:hypothetical protein
MEYRNFDVYSTVRGNQLALQRNVYNGAAYIIWVNVGFIEIDESLYTALFLNLISDDSALRDQAMLDLGMMARSQGLLDETDALGDFE